MAAKPMPIPFEAPAATPATVASENSLFELDRELDSILELIEDEIEENGEAPSEAMDALTLFAEAMNLKIDRIGGYLQVMETRASHCKRQAERFATRTKRAENKIARTKRMVLEYLGIHELKKIESNEFTLRRQKNSVDSVIIANRDAVPSDLKAYELKLDGPFFNKLTGSLADRDSEALERSVRSAEPSNTAIKQFIASGGTLEGVSVRREYHLRVE